MQVAEAKAENMPAGTRLPPKNKNSPKMIANPITALKVPAARLMANIPSTHTASDIAPATVLFIPRNRQSGTYEQARTK